MTWLVLRRPERESTQTPCQMALIYRDRHGATVNVGDTVLLHSPITGRLEFGDVERSRDGGVVKTPAGPVALCHAWTSLERVSRAEVSEVFESLDLDSLGVGYAE